MQETGTGAPQYAENKKDGKHRCHLFQNLRKFTEVPPFQKVEPLTGN